MYLCKEIFIYAKTARRSNQSILKEINLNIQWKDWCWSWNSNTFATWWEELAHWKRLWCWERLKAGGEGDDRGSDGWMASLTRWTWVWASSGSWWWTGKPGVLQSMGSQRVKHDWVTELNWCIENENNNLKGICTTMFIATLFTILRYGNNLCVYQWINV